MLASPLTEVAFGMAPVKKSGEDGLGKDDFLKLLVAQLQNQDPMKPLESTDFTAQLAQFSGLDQLFDINTQLQALQATQASSNRLDTVGFLGREVVTPSVVGRVTGVDWGGVDPVLFVGNERVPLADVIRVHEIA